MNIEVVNQGFIQLIRINRPESLNALNKETLDELSSVLDVVKEDAKVRVLVITGSGEKAFVAGADIKEFADYGRREATAMSATGHEHVFDKIANFPKPIIAAINGFALGGGLELALACHIRYCSDNAKLGLPEVTLGLIPGYGGTQRLTRLIGKGRAMEMILSAKMIDAVTAHQVGLVNAVFIREELINGALEMAETIAKNSPMGIAAAIEAINASDTEKGFAKEIALFGKLFDGADKKEGVAAFLEKRKPNF